MLAKLPELRKALTLVTFAGVVRERVSQVFQMPHGGRSRDWRTISRHVLRLPLGGSRHSVRVREAFAPNPMVEKIHGKPVG